MSIVHTFYVYTGGAHGNYYFATDNFALQPAVIRFSLDTFFRRDRDYREVLGLQSREALRRRAWEWSLSKETSASEFYATIFDRDEEWLISGTSFKENEKVDFTFSENGLTLYFPPYQVACFAAGSWEVTLPYYDLREILRPNGMHQLFIPTSAG